MGSEVRRDEGGAGAAERQRELAGALQEAHQVLDDNSTARSVEALSPVIERLARVEAALARHGEDFSAVFITLGLVLGARCLSRGEYTPSGSGSKDRTEALRRLRWADRHGPPADLLIVQARMMLIFLLAPWNLPRADGTRTVLRNALLTSGHREDLLTESLRQDLGEAGEVADRIAAAPLDAEFQERTARVKGVIERMLGPGAVFADDTAGAGGGPDVDDDVDDLDDFDDVDETDGPEDTDDPESALLDAVRGLVALAGARSTAKFTRILLWLIAALVPGTGDHAGEHLELDPEASALLRRAAAGRAAGVDGIRRAADLALRALHALPPDAPERGRVARLHAYLLVEVESLEPGSADFRTVERPTPDPADDNGNRLDDWPVGLTLEPGLAAFLDGRLRDFAAELGVRERRQAASIDRLLAYRTGDTGYLEDAATLLAEAIDASPDSWWVTALRAELAKIQEQAAADGGSFHDADSSLATMRELGAALRHDGSLPLDAPFTLELLLSTADSELRHAERTGNHEALPRLVEELRARYAALPEDSEWRGRVAERLSQFDQLGTDGEGAVAEAVDLTAERADLERVLAETRRRLGEPEVYAQHEYDQRVVLGMRMYLSFLRGLKDPALLDGAITELTRARALLAEGRGGTRRVDVLMKLAEVHLIRAAGGGPRAAEDRRAFVEITREALGELAADVLLQIGADHGLSAALLGAVLSRRLALVAHRTGRPADEVADLEKGRALVLQAAAASRRSIPELLDTAGHPELARQWRAQAHADPLRPTSEADPPRPTPERDPSRPTPETAPSRPTPEPDPPRPTTANTPPAATSDAPPQPTPETDPPQPTPAHTPPAAPSDAPPQPTPETDPPQPTPANAPPSTTAAPPPPPTGTPPIPSALRRKALAALGVRPGAAEGPGIRQLVGAADVAQLTEGLAAAGTDALVYLVPGAPLANGSWPGHALILRPGARPTTLALPELANPDSGPLGRYLDAAEERSRAVADPKLHASWKAAWEAHWQAALRELCEWAWKAVMGPVLAALRPLSAALGPYARPPRIVLVPCGRLGVVPWHAARLRGLGEHGHRYACQEAVLSYAPSGAHFLAAAARRRMPPADGPQVLVADPELTLPWAEVETVALRAGCYPDALRYGEFVSTDEVPDAEGTPAELLAVLPGGASPASVVHLSCHAVAAPRPTDSALWLAAPPGAGQDAGRLTVAGILDGASGRRPDSAGPLVVLSACETDLSTRHHDEALTLTTALVTGGAADVVGSRWAVHDSATAVMMAVFHHHLTAGGLAPPDALRAAQLWMLNPHRKAPPTLDGLLRREATRPDLHRLHNWAAFTHQGNPAPAPTG
ncbi:CHAT domain-containing protein [Streptomyces diastatochromogenes]|uniref:CHAT domain-containing protein n=1 Tax=Streptomyces diastatochromogenes TaxID=42236 RepID=UPI0036630C02